MSTLGKIMGMSIFCQNEKLTFPLKIKKIDKKCENVPVFSQCSTHKIDLMNIFYRKNNI